MARTATLASTDAPDADYIALVTRYPLRAIRTDADHARAVEVMTMVALTPDPRPGELMYRDALAAIIEHHESAIFPEPATDPARRLRSLLESRQVSQSDVAKATGVSQSSISDILAGRRKVSRKVAAAMGSYFAVDPAAFF
ncbi:helix-turn-helix domain-containing protein [Isosphaeraceae bacterium EP7]